MRIVKTLIKWLFAGLATLLLAGVAALLFFGLVPAGSTWLVAQLADTVSKPGQTILIGNVSGLLSGNLRIDQVVLIDRKGKAITARGISVDWSPLDLISGRFSATNVHAETVSIERIPDLPPSPSDAPAAWPSLPVAIDIADLSIDNLGLAKPVAGAPYDLSVKASLSADNDQAAIKLAIADEARPGAGIKADLSFNPAANQLTANASIAEPKGGVIAGLLKLAGRPAIDMTLSGTGPLSDWKGKLTAALDGQNVIAVDATHQSDDQSHRFIVSGTADLAAQLPEAIRIYLAGQTQLDLDISRSNAGLWSVGKASLTSASIRLAAKGTYDPAGNSDLSASLDPVAATIDAIIPLGDQEANARLRHADITLKGPADNLALTGKIDLATLAAPQGTLTDTLLTIEGEKIALADFAGSFTAKIDIAAADLVNPDLARLVAGPIRLVVPASVSAEAISIATATLESGRMGGTVSAKLARADNSVTGDGQLFVLSEALPEPWAAKLGGKIGVKTTFATTQKGEIALSDLTVSHDRFTLTGALDYAPGAIKADLKASLADVGLVLSEGSGAMDIAIKADGPLDGPTVNLTLDAPDATFAGRPVKALHADIAGTASRDKPVGTIKATGTIDGQEILVDAEAKADQGIIRIPGLSVRIGPNRLTGSIDLAANLLPSGTLAFELPDLSLVAALAGEKATGSLSGTASLTTIDGKLALDLKAKGAGLEARGLSLTEPDIALTTKDLMSGALSGTARIGTLASGANLLKALEAEFSTIGGKTAITLDAGYDNKPLSLKATIHSGAAPLTIDLASFSAMPRGIPVKLAAPVTITVDQGIARLDGLAIVTGKGKIVATGTAGSNLDLGLKIDALPLALANAFQPSLGAEGSLSGTVTLKGPAASPVIRYDVALANAAIADTRKSSIAPFAIKAKGNLTGPALAITIAASNAGGLKLDGGGNLSILPGGALSLKFSGTLPLAVAGPMLAGQGLALQGDAKIALTIGGQSTAPAISGTLTTTNGRIIDVRRNLALNDISASLRIEPAQATIQSLTGTLSTGGKVTAKGTVGIRPGSGFPANIAVVLDDVTYVQGELATASLAGNLTLDGPLLTAPKLSGKVRIKRAGVNIPEKMPASLAAIDVQHKNAGKAVNRQTEEMRPKEKSSGTDSRFSLNLDIQAPSQIFVRGRGLDAELGGKLTLSGDIGNPVVSGGFSMKRGRLSILGKRLDFTSGTISFGGGLVPVLNLAATSTINATTVTVKVSGPADDPVFSFSSSPALPEDEVLAQLIFGRSSTALSPFQIAQLADAAAQLAGGRKSSLFDKLRKGLGVDDLDVTTDDAGNTTVKAGKYLNKRTYVEVEKGQVPGSSKATINLDIGKGVKLKGSAGTDGTGAAGIFYEKEY